MTSTTTTNPYLEGNYAPVTEEVTAFDLAVEGELPAELDGRYVRNGPNPSGEVDPETHHWFLGDGMVHGIRLGDGKAQWYRNRYVGSGALAATIGRPDIEGPNWTGQQFGPNTNVGGWAGRTWAMVEAGGVPVELTDELESVCRNDFFGTLPGAFSAHPKFDAQRRELHAMCYAWPHWPDFVQYVVVGDDGLVKRTVDIEVPGMTMVHDMSLTERFAVLYDQPVTVDFDLVATRPFPFSWNPDYGNRVGLLPRDGHADDIVWVDVPLGYCFHPLNAYDAVDGSVVLDLCLYDQIFADDRNGPFGEGGSSVGGLRLERWTIDPERRTVSTTVIDDRANEFPRHNGAVGGLPYRYGYTTAPAWDAGAAWPTIKHDLTTGERTQFDHGPGRAAGEPVFVARAAGDGSEDSVAEDDGWLVMFVHDLGTESTDFVVLDAQDLGRGEVAKVKLPQRVPFGFHGNWIPS
ncbi:MAG: carotenoid oxygenase family protein [Acidimicrobiales bacterium]